MKAMRIKVLIALSASVLLMSSCGYEKLPPKTGDANTSYVLPKGVVPTDEEKAIVDAAKLEYETNTTK